MTHTKMKLTRTLSLIGAVSFTVAAFLASPAAAQSSKKFAIFADDMPSGTQWTTENKFVRKGGNPNGSTHYIYLKPSDSPAQMTGLSMPIRKNPGAGEYRYITFRWIKWGGEEIGIRFGHDSGNGIGEKYNYTYAAGKGDTIKNALMVGDEAPGNWTAVT
ncbi:MAG: MotA/TolQ/ExbB proton channel family protein, partial [Chitinophagaceae bacterium]